MLGSLPRTTTFQVCCGVGMHKACTVSSSFFSHSLPPSGQGRNEVQMIQCRGPYRPSLRCSASPATQTSDTSKIPELIEFLKGDLPHLFDDQGIDASKYDQRVEFVDPITRHRSLQGYLLNIAFLKTVFSPLFQLLDIRQTGPSEITTRWVMTLKPTFVRFGLQRFWDPTLRFTGTSVMTVDPASGRFIRHVDTWDAINNQSFPSAEGFAHMLSQVFDLRRTPKDLDTPPYQLLLKRAQYEVRRYGPFTVAEAPGGDSRAFGTLAGYLFGRNVEQRSMEMTTPVYSSKEGRMQFYLGRESSVGSAPKPLDMSVEVREVPGGTFAVGIFGGIAGEAEGAERAAALRRALLADGLQPGEGWVLARYNDPTTLPPFRRNEVLIPLDNFVLPA